MLQFNVAQFRRCTLSLMCVLSTELLVFCLFVSPILISLGSYITEPPTSGKVLLETTHGDVEIELWCKEAPVACRNFVQLCMEG